MGKEEVKWQCQRGQPGPARDGIRNSRKQWGSELGLAFFATPALTDHQTGPCSADPTHISRAVQTPQLGFTEQTSHNTVDWASFFLPSSSWLMFQGLKKYRGSTFWAWWKLSRERPHQARIQDVQTRWLRSACNRPLRTAHIGQAEHDMEHFCLLHTADIYHSSFQILIPTLGSWLRARTRVTPRWSEGPQVPREDFCPINQDITWFWEMGQTSGKWASVGLLYAKTA